MKKAEKSSDFRKFLQKVEELDVDETKGLRPTNFQEAKERFLGEVRHFTFTHETGMPPSSRPGFEYGDLDRAEIKESVSKCQELSIELMHENLSDDERKFARWMFSNVYAKWRLLEAASDLNCFGQLDNTLSKESVEARFRRCNERLYGAPDKETFLKLLSYQLASLPNMNSLNDDWEVRLELELRLADIEGIEPDDSRYPSSVLPFMPLRSTITTFRTLLGIWQRPLQKYIVAMKDEYSAEDVATILARILDEQYPESEFQVKIDEVGSIFWVNQIDKEIFVPRTRVRGNYSRSDLEALILGHEWTHILRGVSCEKSPLKAISTGLPEGMAFEEGVAMCVEKALRGKCGAETLAGFDHYVNVGLAYLFGRDFREVFEIRWRLLFLANQKERLTRNERITKAQELAFVQTMRAFRGTEYLPNCKDLVYYNGSVKAWQYIEGMGGNYKCLMHELFECGKIDPTNEMHCLAQRLVEAM